jgi:hypothetical protein
LERRAQDRVARACNVAPAAFSEKLNNLDNYVQESRTSASRSGSKGPQRSEDHL